MKFIARKGAPDIPLELMEAQENGEFVFFGGSGISHPSGQAFHATGKSARVLRLNKPSSNLLTWRLNRSCCRINIIAKTRKILKAPIIIFMTLFRLVNKAFLS